MRSGLSLIVFGLLAGVAAFLATLLKQKNEALDGAQARIAHVEQRMSRMVGASLTADQEAELRTQLAQQSAELERLRALVATLQAQPDVSTSFDTYAGEIAQRSAPVGAVTEQPTDEVKALPADPDQWRRRFEAEAGWQERSPALAALGQTLGRLPEAKLNFANRAVQTKIVPTVVERPHDLSAVDGIGAVFEQRLYNAGIGAYWELATLDDETLQRALKVGKTQAATINLDAIRASAGRLAEESGTVGHLWSGEPVDDFEPIQGIGKIYEQRLYDAGIRTYAALAKATPEVLQSACPSRSPIPPDYSGWIEAAKRLAGE
jgi:predicted flap endonuclease-1-like 5' DNA nuclease